MPPFWNTDKPLRGEQLRSLHWMQQRESRDTCNQFTAKYKRYLQPNKEPKIDSNMHTDAWCMDFEVNATYNVKGGILADKIGFGKTATCIGLMISQKVSDEKYLNLG